MSVGWLRIRSLSRLLCRTSSTSSYRGAATSSRYNQLEETDVDVFSQILHHNPSLMYGNASDVIESASADWTGHWTSPASLVLRPQTTLQVSAILSHCNQRRLAVVPQGGNTGLVGGSVPTAAYREIVLQLQNMNQIERLDPLNGVVQCQAGVVLQTLQDYCAERQLLVPLDLGAKGTCQIGGTVATNAGGQYFRRYGSLAGNVLGLQVVLADGRVLDLNYSETNFKDNTGYKLHQLFVGSEGTLGVITGVALACSPLPVSKNAAFVACPSYGKVLCVLQKAQQHLGEILAAMEFMDSTIWRLVEDSGRHKMPMSADSLASGAQEGGPFFLLIDTHGSSMEDDEAKWQQFLDAIQGDIVSGVMAQDLQQYQSFWRIRESSNPTIAQLGYTYKYDVSLPIAQFHDWIQEMRRERLDLLAREEVVNSNWGHILDGNLHFNVTTVGERDPQPDVISALEPYLFQSILNRGGSISAEHGLGQSKNHLLPSVHDKHTLEVMQSIKALKVSAGRRSNSLNNLMNTLDSKDVMPLFDLAPISMEIRRRQSRTSQGAVEVEGLENTLGALNVARQDAERKKKSGSTTLSNSNNSVDPIDYVHVSMTPDNGKARQSGKRAPEIMTPVSKPNREPPIAAVPVRKRILRLPFSARAAVAVIGSSWLLQDSVVVAVSL